MKELQDKFSKVCNDVERLVKIKIKNAYIDEEEQYFTSKLSTAGSHYIHRNNLDFSRYIYPRYNAFINDLIDYRNFTSPPLTPINKRLGEIILRQVNEKVIDYFNYHFKFLRIKELLSTSCAIPYANNVFAVNYDPFGTSDITVIHYCKEVSRWIHRDGLKLRCRQCSAIIRKGHKMSALLTFKLKNI